MLLETVRTACTPLTGLVPEVEAMEEISAWILRVVNKETESVQTCLMTFLKVQGDIIFLSKDMYEPARLAPKPPCQPSRERSWEKIQSAFSSHQGYQPGPITIYLGGYLFSSSHLGRQSVNGLENHKSQTYLLPK